MSFFEFIKIILTDLSILRKERSLDMDPLQTQEDYSNYVDKKSPNSPIVKNLFNAFWVGGLICTIGQFIYAFCTYKGLDQTSASTVVSICLIGLSAFLTAINVFNKIGKFAGAGSLVPITGFANSIVSPAMEYKSEGYVMGVGAKMFTVAGPVLVYGISASVIVGLIACFFI
jgi:stage V sporulation protein AC